MLTSTPPKAVAVEVVATQTSEADKAMVAQLRAESAKPLEDVAYVVKMELKTMPDATAEGWALYVDKLRIPKYWAYDKGIYFKVMDPQFFSDHKGAKLRFSKNGTDFTDTGLKLTVPLVPRKGARGLARLPRQDEVLK
jgi:hypothetical protein